MNILIEKIKAEHETWLKQNELKACLEDVLNFFKSKLGIELKLDEYGGHWKGKLDLKWNVGKSEYTVSIIVGVYLKDFPAGESTVGPHEVPNTIVSVAQVLKDFNFEDKGWKHFDEKESWCFDHRSLNVVIFIPLGR